MKDKYIIPANFMETGYVLNGAVAWRNAIEGVILGILGYSICNILPLPGGLDNITYYILIIFPMALLGLTGVQGDPLSVFIVDVLKWRKRRKPYLYNNHGLAYTQAAADKLFEAPQFRDMLADAIEKMRNSMAEEDMEYIEGVTFRFADDPEAEALRSAQEEILEKAKPQAVVQKEEKAEAPAQTSKVSAGEDVVNARKIQQMLVLEDLGEEDEDG